MLAQGQPRYDRIPGIGIGAHTVKLLNGTDAVLHPERDRNPPSPFRIGLRGSVPRDLTIGGTVIANRNWGVRCICALLTGRGGGR